MPSVHSIFRDIKTLINDELEQLYKPRKSWKTGKQVKKRGISNSEALKKTGGIEMENQDFKQLIGKCGFYCGSCPDFIKGICTGCRTSHKRGDCYTFDCVDEQELEFCGTCNKFPCKEIMTKDKATVLDTRWLKWRETKRDSKE